MYKKKRIVRPKKRGEIFYRKKVCRFCSSKANSLDYKDVAQLQKLITERGKIIPPRLSGTCARHQRMVALAIKRARVIALLSFVKQG